jgi:cysteinyl-tRNA synthetase
MMQAHYRSILDFSSEALLASEKGFVKLMTALVDLNSLKESSSSSEKVGEMISSFYAAMNDDFNTPILIANIFEAVTYINKIKDGSATISAEDLDELKSVLNTFIFDVLGLKEAKEGDDSKLDAVMNVILEIRKKAREEKDWTTSDLLRDKLAEAGIQIKDSKEGVTYTIQ